MIKFFRFIPVAILLLLTPVSFSAPLSGVYTIGGSSPSYATFTAAVNALLGNGVSGPVTFNVRAGTYTEHVTLSAVTGASATNTIRFQSATGNAADVTLQYAATSPDGTNAAGDNWVVDLDGASYITFNNLTLVATGAEYANVIYMYNYSNYDTVKNCVITGIASTSTSMEQVLVNLAADQNYGEPSASGEVIINNVLTNGSYGVYTGVRQISVSTGKCRDWGF